MGFDMYAVSQYKKGKDIAGFRIVALHYDGKIEVKDVEYEKVLPVASKGIIKNLKVEDGKIKGVNGSLDRYAIRGVSQALVILKEFQDMNGNTLKYRCSDAEGNIRDLTIEQVILFANKFSIANGKLVTDSVTGKQHLSAIEGNYEVRKVDISKNKKQAPAQKQQAPAPTQNTAPTPAATPAPAPTAPTPNGIDKLGESDKQLISKVMATPNFAGSTADGIVNTIKERGFCSRNQRWALNKHLENNGIKEENVKIGLTNEVKNVMADLKTYSYFKGSKIADVVASVERKKDCTTNQFNYMKDELKRFEERFRKENTPKVNTSATPASPVQTQTPVQSTTTTQAPTQSSVQSTPVVNSNQQNVTNNTNGSNLTSTTPVKVQPVNSIDEASLKKMADRNKKFRETADREARENIRKLAEELAKTKKQRQADLRMTVDGIFDYSISKNGEAFLEGIHAGAEAPDNIIVPDTMTKDGKTYKVVGLSAGAFKGETTIKSVKTGRNIKDIGQECFRGCANLETLDLSQSMHTLIPARMCYECRKLVNIAIGDFVEKIHEYAFYNTGIISITLSSMTETISQYAFAVCEDLVSIIGRVKVVDAYACYNCPKLQDFNFETVLRISTYGFKNCGFKSLKLTGTTTSIGNYAFADNNFLETVDIEEGVEELGEQCFSKNKLTDKAENGYCPIQNINAPRSLKHIGYSAFHNAVQVTGYTGTQAESNCIASGVPFHALDELTEDNATTVRITSKLLGTNPMETLKFFLENKEENGSNPVDFELPNKKLLKLALGDATLSTLGIASPGAQIDPHVKFKGAVKYLQDVANLFKTPLTSIISRWQNVFYVNTDSIYDDGWNRISKISYEMMDTLDKGEFILVTQGNDLVFMTDCNVYTDINMTSDLVTDDNLPILEYIHAGDTIGEQTSVLSGASGTIKDEGAGAVELKANIGKMFYDTIARNSISISISRKDRYLYIPAKDMAIKLHDKSNETVDENNKKKSRSEAVLLVTDYDRFLSSIKADKKQLGGSEKFFEKLSSMSDAAVNRRIKDTLTIGVEKEAQLLKVSQKFAQIAINSGGAVTPNLLTIDIFNELAKSYWMISKDEAWLRATGKKSLNQTAEYHIGDCKLTEYKSNQIVKFSNPYMNGKKGAYVYVLTKNNTCLGIYASRYSMHTITDKLFAMSDIPETITEIPEIMKDKTAFDKVDESLFYKFYNILESKNGHNTTDYFYFRQLFNNEYAISMYKPTGVFYITTSRLVTERRNGEENIRVTKTIPLLPIGDMNKALIVATTTNTGIRNNKRLTSLLDELDALSAQLYYMDNSRTRIKSDKAGIASETYDRYLAARAKAILGIRDINEYKGLIDDRIIFMMGVVHNGELQREDEDTNYSVEDDIDEINADDIEIDFGTPDSDDTEIDLDDSTEEFELETDDSEEADIDEEIDETSDEEMFDIEDDDVEEEQQDNSDVLTFEEFFETAKALGITLESQARAMYVDFLSQQQK